jgi:hypothetical protein
MEMTEQIIDSSRGVTQPTRALDAGAKGRERLAERRTAIQKAAFLFKATIWTIVLVLLLVLAGIAGWGYHTMETGRVTDSRPCFVKVGKTEFTGSREYHYAYHDIFNFRFFDRDNIEVTTTLKVRGGALVVAGIGGDGDYTSVVGMGEVGIERLKKADKYVLVTDTGATIIGYDEICK